MSRRAAEAGFARFLDPTMAAIRREFSLGRALRGTGLGPGGYVVDRLRNNAEELERRVVEPEVNVYRERSFEQFQAVLDYVESDEPIEAFTDRLLAHDSYVESLDPSVTEAQRAAVADDVLARLERLGAGVEPIVRRPEDDFWTAAAAAFDRDEALVLVEEAFPFTGPLRTYRDLIVFEVRLDPNDVLGGPFVPHFPSLTIDYTDEAVRSMTRAERRVVEELKREIDARFESEA